MLHFHFPKESSPAESVLSCPDLVMVEANTSSSLEIVDALTEAAEDTPDQHLQKVRMHNFLPIMSKISISF